MSTSAVEPVRGSASATIDIDGLPIEPLSWSSGEVKLLRRVRAITPTECLSRSPRDTTNRA